MGDPWRPGRAGRSIHREHNPAQILTSLLEVNSSGTTNPQDCKIMNVCSLKSPGLWLVATASVGNESGSLNFLPICKVFLYIRNLHSHSLHSREVIDSDSCSCSASQKRGQYFTPAFPCTWVPGSCPHMYSKKVQVNGTFSPSHPFADCILRHRH